eukprot:2098240-Amphidinium_carterae.1
MSFLVLVGVAPAQRLQMPVKVAWTMAGMLLRDLRNVEPWRDREAARWPVAVQGMRQAVAFLHRGRT